MSEDIRENVTRRGIWLRLVFMIVLGVAFNIAELLMFAVTVFQFLASLITGRPNDQLARFGRNLARYLQQIVVFLVFATEEKPFPFAQFPDGPQENAAPEEDGGSRDDDPERRA